MSLAEAVTKKEALIFGGIALGIFGLIWGGKTMYRRAQEAKQLEAAKQAMMLEMQQMPALGYGQQQQMPQMPQGFNPQQMMQQFAQAQQQPAHIQQQFYPQPQQQAQQPDQMQMIQQLQQQLQQVQQQLQQVQQVPAQPAPLQPQTQTVTPQNISVENIEGISKVLNGQFANIVQRIQEQQAAQAARNSS